MTINRHTATRQTTNGSIAVTVENGTWIETVYSDGWETGTKTHVVNNVRIDIKDKTGKILASDSKITPMEHCKHAPEYNKALSMGCKGRVWQAWIGPATYDAIQEAMDEALAAAPMTDEQIAIESAEAAKAAEAEAWRNSPQGKAEAEAWRNHERLMREMDRPDSDY